MLQKANAAEWLLQAGAQHIVLLNVKLNIPLHTVVPIHVAYFKEYGITALWFTKNILTAGLSKTTRITSALIKMTKDLFHGYKSFLYESEILFML